MSKYIHILHITRFARWLEESECELERPYIITMGGTDIYIDLPNLSPTEQQRVYQLLKNAAFITLFHDDAQTRLLSFFPDLAAQCRVIPQGILLPHKHGSDKPILKPDVPGTSNQAFHVLLPAGLRKVKDVLHLLPAWVRLSEQINLKVLILGETLEPEVFDAVQRAMEVYPFLCYQPEVSFEQMGSFYSWADVVINSSVEEGQPTALCEAMALGIPVIARDNEGNKAFIKHAQNGFLYSEPLQFVTLVQTLISNPSTTLRLTENARLFVEEKLSLKQEIESYLSLLQQSQVQA